MTIQWATVFDEAWPESGASDEEIVEFVRTVTRPLTTSEIEAIIAQQRNPFPAGDPLHATYRPFDPRNWHLPTNPLPSVYLDFLRWSNGGEFRNADRCFSPFFPALDENHGVRALMLAYHVPQYMPGAVPFAFDGGGTFYLFDMREPPRGGEYPILFCHAGNLAYDEARYVAASFLDACTGTTNPYDDE